MYETCNTEFVAVIPHTHIKLPFLCLKLAGHTGQHHAPATFNGQKISVWEPER